MITSEELRALVYKAYKNAKNKGFFSEGYKDTDYLAAIHDELSEAFKCWNKHLGWYTETPKPDGIYFELTDAVIRVLSYSGYKGFDLQHYNMETDRPYTTDDLTDLIVASHAELSQYYDLLVRDCYDDYSEQLFIKCAVRILSRFIARIELFISEASDDVYSLYDLIIKKLEYNATRSEKHGGNEV